MSDQPELPEDFVKAAEKAANEIGGHILATALLSAKMGYYARSDDLDVKGIITAALAGFVSELVAKREAVHGNREELAEGRDHLTVSGSFRSDKYPWCRVGFVPLKLTDPAARDLLTEYARRRGAIDSAFEFDLYEALDRTSAKQSSRGRYETFETVQELRDGRNVLRDALQNITPDGPRTHDGIWSIASKALAKVDRARKAKP